VNQLALPKTKKKKKKRTLHDDDDGMSPLLKRRDEDSSDDEEDDPHPPPRPRFMRKSKHHSLRQIALVSAAHLPGQDVSNTASVYHARNFP
jgi:hypothetical protein